jgi:hypothetical protein
MQRSLRDRTGHVCRNAPTLERALGGSRRGGIGRPLKLRPQQETPMTTPDTRTGQREALSESERKASSEQPENFKKEETEEKVVEVLPIDGEGAAIKGLDPEK